MDSQQIGLVVGIAMIVIGTILLVVSLVRRKRVTVQASNGIAIGGSVNNSTVISQSRSSEPQSKHGGHGLTIVAIVVEPVGIAVTLWHASHMASLA
ncbi:MAG: hypothetical protein E6Q88_13730 [Lysobacteraceae bacterium]|nr:MAG: hypothetical protein E6Q88_13730 [Xanthomonadaceae bacterium]